MNIQIIRFLYNLDIAYNKKLSYILVLKKKSIVDLCFLLKKEGFILGYMFFQKKKYQFIKIYLLVMLEKKLDLGLSGLLWRGHYSNILKPYNYIIINSVDKHQFKFAYNYKKLSNLLSLSLCYLISTCNGFVFCYSKEDLFFKLHQGGILLCIFVF